MVKFFNGNGAIIFISMALGLSGTACSQPNANVSSNQTITSATPTPQLIATPKPITQSSQTEINAYEKAMDVAESAYTISQSAQSVGDWNLVVSQWQQAIALLKNIPASSPQYAIAKNKIPKYQRNLTSAQLKASPYQSSSRPTSANNPTAPRTTASTSNGDSFPVSMGTSLSSSPRTNLRVIQVPIKRRLRRTPIIDVTFNGQYTFEMILDTGASGTVITQPMALMLGVLPEGEVIADTASDKAVKFGLGKVSSISVNSMVVRNVPVAISGSAMDIGLLGHDFFGNYDVTLKKDFVEFHRR